MASTVYTNRLASPTGVVKIPSGIKLAADAVDSFSQPSRFGEVVQMNRVNDMATTNLQSTSTTETALALTISMTPVYTSSHVIVDFWSTMMQGSGNALVMILYRKIGDGSYVALTPFANAASRYYYGWSYNSNAWGAHRTRYIDRPNTTSEVTYKLHYRNVSTTAVTYLVSQYMEYGWDLMEVKQ